MGGLFDPAGGGRGDTGPGDTVDFWNWLTGHPGAHPDQDRQMLQNQMAGGSPYMQGNPYQGDFGSLIKQLQDQAAGRGPSVAQNAYNAASQNNMAQQMAMSVGGASAGAGRQAAQNMGNIGQGMAQGLASARTGEETAAQQGLGGVLNAASNQNFQYGHANQQAWLDMLAQQLGLTKTQMGQKTNMDQLGGLLQGIGQAGAAL